VNERVDGRLLVITALLVAGGLLILYSASAPFSLRHFGSSSHMLLRQFIAAVAGAIALTVFALLDYRRLATLSDLLLVGGLALSAATLLPFGFADGRWLLIGPFPIQPTEFLKLAWILYLARTIARKKEDIRSFGRGVLPFLFLLSLLAMVLLNQPDLGMLLIFAAVTITMLYLGGSRVAHLAAVCGGSLPLIAFAIRLAPYRFARILSFLNPEAYSTSSGYQTLQSLIAVGSGGVFGRGLGASRAKLFYLPQAHNDFILSVVAEELGLLGMLLILALVGLLVWRAFAIAERAGDELGRLVAYGIGFALAFQALLNAGVVLGLLPVTGLTFPFLSNGGSSLLVSMAMIGVLLNVSRHCAMDRGRLPGGLSVRGSRS